jgi:hypothetical protein
LKGGTQEVSQGSCSKQDTQCPPEFSFSTSHFFW